MVFFGVMPWIPAALGVYVAPALGFGAFSALTAISVALCCLSPALVVCGFLIFIAGLVARSPEELAAMRPIFYAPPQAPPPAPPQVVVVQPPPREREPPPPPPPGR